MTRLTGAALDRAVASVLGIKSVYNCEKWGEEHMKTKQEIKDEIIELYGATQALNEAMNMLHAQRMEKSKQMMSLNHMLKEMDGDDAEEKNT